MSSEGKSTWAVRIAFTEPSYALHSENPLRLFFWTWNGFARGGEDACALAVSAFKALFAASGSGWVREVHSIVAHPQKEAPLLPSAT